MANSKGKLDYRGYGWCNIPLPTGKLKLVIAILLDAELRTFKLISNHSAMSLFKDWSPCEDKPGWFFKEVFESEINEFFEF